MIRVLRSPLRFDLPTIVVLFPLLALCLSTLLGGWTAFPKALAQYRNPLLAAFGIAALSLAISSTRIHPRVFIHRIRERFDPDGLRKFILALYAMMNTLRGRFMESITGIDHFAIHATPALFLLLPLHAVFHSPLFSVIFQAVGLGIGAILFDRCLKARDIAGWIRLGFVFAYLNCIWLSRTLHYGFHVEILYPIAFFVLDLSVTRGKSKLHFFLPALLFLLSIKEDAPFHATAFALAYVLTGKVRWSRFVCTLCLSAATLYLAVMIPSHSGDETYRFAASARGAGADLPSALSFLVENPLLFLRGLATGEWWKLLLPCLPLLALSPFFWIAAAPTLGIYSLVGDSQMRSLTIYYGIPVLGVLALGLADAFNRGRQRITVTFPRYVEGASALAVFGLVFLGSGYLVFRPVNVAFWSGIRSELDLVPKYARVCAPGIFVPHLPYGEVRLLDEECLAGAEYVITLEPSSTLLRFPLDPVHEERIRTRLKEWRRLDEADRERSGQLSVWAQSSEARKP